MNRSVQRRQKRLCKAVIKAIDESIDKLWVSTGIGADGQHRLKRRGRERDNDVIVVVGKPTFGNVVGSAPAPARAFVSQVELFFFFF